MKIGQRFNPHRLFTGVFIPDAIYRHEELSAVAKLLYGRLYKYAGEAGEAYPAGTTLAAELKMSERQVFEHLALLVSEGLIEREPRPGTSTVYHFLWHPCFEQEDGVVRKTALPKSQEKECGKPHYPGAENRTTGSAEILIRRDPSEEIQGKEPTSPTPSQETSPETNYTRNPEDDPESSTYYGVARRSRFPKRPKPDRPHGNSDRLRQLRENATAPRQAAEPGLPAVFRGGVVGQDPPIRPGAPQRDFVGEWNRLVPESPADYTPRFHAKRLESLSQDPDFCSHFTHLCENASQIHRDSPEGEWKPKFSWILKPTKPNDSPNWFKLANGELNFKKNGRRKSGSPDYVDALMKELENDTQPTEQP